MLPAPGAAWSVLPARIHNIIIPSSQGADYSFIISAPYKNEKLERSCIFMAKSKKSNGEGSISFEADRKMYRARFTDPQGKRLSQRFKTKKEAKE